MAAYFLSLFLYLSNISLAKMSKKYAHEALVDAVASDLNSRAATAKYNVQASAIRQHRREPNLSLRAGSPTY